MGFGILGATVKLKEWLKKIGTGILKAAKNVTGDIKKALDIPVVKGLVNSLSKMVGIPVSVGVIVSRGAGLVSAGADVPENFLTNKPKKHILKNTNKFDFKRNFDQMSNLIKTRTKK
jgi:hypothetical protein